MRMLPYDIALFDADDTLFDFGAAAAQSLQRALEQFGLPCNEEIRQSYMRINQSVWDMLERGEITRIKLQTERFRLFFGEQGFSADLDAFNEAYIRGLGEGSALFPGAWELCREASRLLRTAIVTNGFARTQESRMERSGLNRWMEKVYISEEVGHAKPAKEFFDAVLADLNISGRKRVILLGDSLTSDMAGGIGAGIVTCWYNPAGKPSNGLRPDYEIRVLGDFLKILRGEALS